MTSATARKKATTKKGGARKNAKGRTANPLTNADEKLRLSLQTFRSDPTVMGLIREEYTKSESTLTVGKVHKVVDLLKEGNYLATALQLAGIGSSAWQNWMVVAKKAAKRLAADCNAPLTEREEVCLYALHLSRGARNEGEATLVHRINVASIDDWKAASFILARTRPERWGQNREKLPDQTNVQVNVNSGVLLVPRNLNPQPVATVSGQALSCGSESQRLIDHLATSLIDTEIVDVATLNTPKG